MLKHITKLESERLVLYPMDESFISKNYLSWLNDNEVNRYLETRGSYDEKKLIKFIKVSIKKKICFWAITEKKNGTHIGNIKIDQIDFYHSRGEYGVLIGDKNSWGRGYAREASTIVIEFCFKILRLRKITLGVVESNKKALKLYKKLGFKVEGVFVDHGYYQNKLRNIYKMAIFNKSFFSE